MSLGDIGGPPRTRTAHQYVLKSLRDAILNGQLGGGARLMQADLAAQLGVSVTPVREALRDLATQGLVEFDPHRGALVRSLDVHEVRELYELRMILEPMHVRRTFGLVTDAQLDRAAELRDRMEETDSLTDWAELNRQFHAALTVADSRSRLASIIAGLRDSASIFVSMSLSTSPERLAESNAEHAQLLEFYRRRDLAVVERLTIGHLQTTLDTIEWAHGEGLL